MTIGLILGVIFGGLVVVCLAGLLVSWTWTRR